MEKLKAFLKTPAGLALVAALAALAGSYSAELKAAVEQLLKALAAL